MKKILFILFLVCQNLFAQDSKSVDKSFFDDKNYQKYLGEDAVIEYEVGYSYFLYRKDYILLINEVSTRIKILNTDGFDYATVQIPLYRNRYNKESVIVSDAFTYNFEDGKVKKTEFDYNNQFLEHSIGNHWYASFTMPNVKVGSVIEFKTTVISPYLEDAPVWFFQKEIPVKYSKFTFEAPFGIQYIQYINGAEKIKSYEKKGEHIFYANDVPPLKNEGFVSNINNYRASVVHYLSGYRDNNFKIKEFAGNWNDVSKIVNENGKFIEVLKKSYFAKFKTDQLLKDKTFETDKDKIIEILNFVQKNIEWNNIISILPDNDLNKVYDLKKGNSVELNLILVAMLRYAGFKANPIILATKQKGISYLVHPDAFNNVIAGVELNNETILLDATNKFSTINIIPLDNTNWNGRLIEENFNSKEIVLEPKIESKRNVTSYLNFDLQNNTINAKIHDVYSNYEAFVLRNKYKNFTDDKIKEFLQGQYEVEIDTLSISNFNNNNSNVIKYYKLKKENAFDVLADKIYFSPAFIFEISSNIFRQEDRNYPIDFLFPTQNSYSFTYTIPEGYQVESLPENKKMVLKSKVFGVNWNFTHDSKRILFKWNIEFNKAIVDPEEYLNIKKVFEEMVKFMDEKVVLKKI
ncbi:DUF3857 domain-containing protein [Flavobacterium sp. I3-2]|uniref:DUF3857 domain-containing protein n=1 Tax=Flavobacterium sp. I3-2 TaxID=2748319 RepID=UPI0015B2FD4B|nr:DUF3857 domain-containing protein [Flavobacterium sp. I3-2]